MSDLPVESNQDMPVEVMGLPDLSINHKSPKLMSSEGVIVGAMKAARDGLGTESTFLEIHGAKSTLNAYDAVAAEEREEEKRYIAEAYSNIVGTVDDIGAVKDTTNAAQETLQQLRDEPNTAKGKYNPYIRAISTQYTKEEDIEREAGLQAFREDLIKLQEEVTGWDIAETIGKSLLPGATLKDAYDLTKGSDFSAEELLGGMVATFKNSSPERQKELWPLYKEFLSENLEKTDALSTLQSLLDPANDADITEDFNSFFIALDVVDTGATAIGLAASAARLMKNTNAIRTAKRTGNDDVANTLNDAVVSDKTGKTAEAVGETRAQAADNAAGFAVDSNYTQGLNQHAQERIRVLREGAETLVQRIEEEDIINIEPAILEQRREAVKKEQVLNYKTKLEQEGAIVDEVRFTNNGDRGFTAEFTVNYDTASGPTAGVETFNYNYTVDDVGALQDLELEPFQQIRSPLGIFEGDVQDVVKSAIRLEEQSAAIKLEITNLAKKALEPLTGGPINKIKNIFGSPSVKKLNKVLQSGDASASVYSVQQLRRGINGISLSEKEIEAYYNLRNVYDTLWEIDNRTLRNTYVTKGYKQTTVGTENVFVKYYDDIPPTTARKVYDPDSNKLRDLGSDELEDLYSKGYKVGRSDGYISSNGNKYTHILSKAEDIQEIPTVAKQYRNGYVPRIREKGLYYVKTSKRTSVDGVSVPAFSKGSNISTIRSFDTRKQADEFAATHALDEGEEIRVLEDRELEAEAVTVSGVEGTGLFRGHRAEEDVLHGPDADAPTILNPIEAMSRNITFISNKITRSEWRLARQEEWIKTANKYMDFRVEDFNAPMPSTTIGKALDRLREDIKVWGRIEDNDEGMLADTLQRVFEWGVGRKYGANELARSARWLRDKNPVGQIRGAAFHALLGWFNLIQLWVQAQGALPALSISPKFAPKALHRQTLLGMVQNVDSPEAIAKTARRWGMNADELISLKKLYEKTGIGKAIKANADINDAIGGGTSSLRQLADKGLIFYRMGEGFSRRTAFNTAVAEWQSANKGRKLDSVTNDELRSIMTRTNNFLLNLNKANGAQWQRGVLSIPTQFMQVTAKAWGNMAPELLGGNNIFTPAEKIKLLVGQTAMYGAAGLPFGYALYDYWAQLTGKTQEDIQNMSDSERAAVNGGIQGLAMYSIFGHELVVGPRGSLSSGYDSIAQLLLERRVPLVEALAGPFGSVFKRTMDAGDKFRAITVDLDDPQYTLLKAGEALVNASGIISSSRNLQKAWEMWHHGWILSGKGESMAQDFEYAETIAAGLGFQLQREANIFAAKNVGKARAELKANTAQMLREATLSFLRLKDNISAQDIDRYEALKNTLISNPALSPYDVEELKNGHATFLKKMLNKDTAEARAMQKMIEAYGTGLQEDFRTITEAGIIKLDDTEHEEFKEFLK